MARFFDVHPDDPQPRALAQVAAILREGGVIAYPTDCAYALGCLIGNADGLDRIRTIRQLDERHHFTVMCRNLKELSSFAEVSNAAFRAVKACTPGPYTFILPATKDVPRRLQHPRKRTIGVRIPRGRVVHALLEAVGEPIVSTTLLLPSDEAPLTQGWDISQRLEHVIDAVVDAGDCTTELTTIVDLSGREPEVIRHGVGDASRFEE